MTQQATSGCNLRQKLIITMIYNKTQSLLLNNHPKPKQNQKNRPRQNIGAAKILALTEIIGVNKILAPTKIKIKSERLLVLIRVPASG
jgi:hypothetical protein